MRLSAALACILLCSVPLAGCFGETEDEDGLSAEVEREGWVVQVVLAGGETRSYDVTSSPSKPDEDDDGQDDFQEHLHRTDPRKADTDEDGLLDGRNVRLDADAALAKTWREAGIVHSEAPDGKLLFHGEFGDPGSSHGAEPLQQDTDGDGLLDGEEVGGYPVAVCGETRQVRTLAWAEDTDGDSIDDRLERTLGLDPTARDTDGDSVNDQNDLDPCADLRVRFHVRSLELEGTGQSGPLSFHVTMPEETYRSDEAAVARGEPFEGDTFDSDVLDPSDDGADLRAGAYNLSFSVTLLTQRDGQPARLDVFSATAGAESLIARLDARTMEISLASGPEATFSGPDGAVTIAFTRA